MPTLWLIRHGETALNAERRYQGHLDPPLSAVGRTQARALGPQLTAQITDQATSIAAPLVVSSDLLRARQTAELALPDHTPTLEPRLRELDFGEFDALTYDENLARHGRLFRSWIDDPTAVRPPAGESVAELETRLFDWLRGLSPRRAVIAFTHGGPILVLSAIARGVPLTVERPPMIAPGSVLRVDLDLSTTT